MMRLSLLALALVGGANSQTLADDKPNGNMALSAHSVSTISSGAGSPFQVRLLPRARSHPPPR